MSFLSKTHLDTTYIFTFSRSSICHNSLIFIVKITELITTSSLFTIIIHRLNAIIIRLLLIHTHNSHITTNFESGSNYDSLKSIVTRGQAGYWSCLAQVTLLPPRGTAGNMCTSTSARGVLPRMWRRMAKRSVATKERKTTSITILRNGYLEP